MAYTQRTVDWCITRAFIHAQRKGTPPAVGTDKYTVLLAIADSVQKSWENEPNIEWNSLYDLVSTGTVTATDTFDLDDSINYISKRLGDFVLVTNGTQTVKYVLVGPNQLYSYKDVNAVAQIGRTLKFSKAFTATSSTLGYTIEVPAILFVDDIESGSDLIQIDDPMYAVYSMAAEFVRNDVVKAGQYDNLLAMAENSMNKMKANNGGTLDEIPREAFVAGATFE